MKTSRVILHVLLILLSLFPAAPMLWEVASAYGPTVVLWAASGATIAFQSQNGQLLNNVPPQASLLPHLVLFRNGVLTEPGERTLVVQLQGLEVPPPGVTVTVELTTLHPDPECLDEGGAGIVAWRRSRVISNNTAFTRTGATVSFRVEFGETVPAPGERGTTPTDYYRCEVVVLAGRPAAPRYTWSTEVAFLLENQWVVPLPAVRENEPRAAPVELALSYCDMFPFRRDPRDPTTGLPRREVAAYVGDELIPALLEAFRVQSVEWGYSWHRARPGTAGESERLNVALSEGETWYHGVAPPDGHSGISINVNARSNANYDTLTEGILSTFHHELFHQLQRNMCRSYGGNTAVSGRGGAWAFFSEGTAGLASSVGQPAVQFARSAGLRAYMTRVDLFLGRGQVVGGLNRLNRSYDDLSPYEAALYWRFLYEQCGGMRGGREDPAAGMQIIWRALAVLYGGDPIDIDRSTDLVGGMPQVMDRALVGSACPFQSYAESLASFAQAVYALRLERGRCLEPGRPAGCGFYDPNGLYPVPPIDTIPYIRAPFVYDAAVQAQPAGIPSSYGVDLVEIPLAPAARQPLTIAFHAVPAGRAEFELQLWALFDPHDGTAPRRISSPVKGWEVPIQVQPGGHQVYVVPASDGSAWNRLALIVTRIDGQESIDSVGAYTVVLTSGSTEAFSGANRE